MANKLDELKDLLEIVKGLSALEAQLKAEGKLPSDDVPSDDDEVQTDEVNKSEKEDEIDKQFADKCSMTVTVTKDDEHKGSWVEVKFDGVEGKPDLMMMGVSAMSAIADHFPKKKVETLAAICTLALTGEKGGIHRIGICMGEEEED